MQTVIIKIERNNKLAVAVECLRCDPEIIKLWHVSGFLQ